ncbi:hypothetical protein GGU10DRAFT_366309 [Lentinula aff. detonsa]|uniref:Zn(2)-C6 fungal-type domain-containing protein n=1 Tax=Lentinula aff. detonsa TaxID=2804958 RepID=A0AA38L3F8_9AGAR|nr:hypothetical protein GGU10DRAFT_366309 [Lentinula aff. detonsa]
MSTASSISGKRKKPPACDYCKVHRVLCHPQLNGPCPRCAEKGVNCQTTPVIRRKRRTKAELVQFATKKEIDTSSPSTSSLPTNIGPLHHPPSSIPLQSNGELSTMVTIQPVPNVLDEPSPVPPTIQMPTEVIKELMQMLRNAPYDMHPIITNPIIPLSRLRKSLQLHLWDLHSLSPQDRVLAHCLLTFIALHSKNPFIIGLGELSTEESQRFTSSYPLKTPVVPDLRQFGFRRESVVRRLWAEALWLANQVGIATNTSKENAASCWILGHLRYVILGKGASAFSAACVYHMRALAEEGQLPTIESELLKLRGHMIGDVVPALMAGKSIPLTLNDEFLIVPLKPESLEQLISTFTTQTCSTSEVFLSIHTFAHNIALLARETVENLTGAYARSQLLDECFLIKHFASLDLFHSFLNAVLQQISWHLNSSRSSPQKMFYLRACSYGFVVSWGSLVLVLFELLRDRSMYNTARMNNADSSEISSHRLSMHLHHARKLASSTAVEISETMRDIPSIMRLLPPSDLVRWARFLLVEENIVDITRTQCLQALECFRDALKLVGFSYADRSGVVDIIDEHLASYVADNMLTLLGQQNSGWMHDYASTRLDWLETGL